MEQGKWDLHSAKAMIERNGGKVGGSTIQHKTPGLKVLGAIDYLCSKHGFTWENR